MRMLGSEGVREVQKDEAKRRSNANRRVDCVWKNIRIYDARLSKLSTVTAAATENGGWEGGRLIGALVSHFASVALSVADTPRKGCFWPLRACFERKPRLAARP
jgi:hypothetical protein